MTDKEIMMARYIKKSILPKLQKMQRDLYFDKHILISVNQVNLYGGMSVTLWVCRDTRAFSETLCCKSFQFFTTDSVETLQSILRGISHFVKNWQERLG